MLQKQIFFLNKLIIVASLIFICFFFVPIFTIDIPLNYRMNNDTLIINVKDLDMKEAIFIQFKKNILIINKSIGEVKINKRDTQRDQIILDMNQFDIKDDIKIFYRFKKSIMNYVLKRRK
ncbi:MAG: hypothetical protein LBU29_04265 [Endomicrobium sp.]|jgi:hypothetical protein|nr:hypothetical protein [Endomicrobium sp.]